MTGMEIERYFVIAHSGANILSHQASIFMLQNMAVIHKGMLARCRLIKGDKKLCLVFNEYRILPAGEMSRRRLFFDGQDTKQRAVDMKRVCHSDRGDFPNFSGSKFCFDINARKVKGFTVYSDQGGHIPMQTSVLAVCA